MWKMLRDLPLAKYLVFEKKM
uniref:Uncharacterized protein n=1 Tax=Arundo donax TaxID=35708 RepID=A0A0A8YF71_ARUDO